MKSNLIVCIGFAVVGVALIILGAMDLVGSVWFGFGGGLVGVSVVNLVRFYRYRTDEHFREEADISLNDERNKFLHAKACEYTVGFYALFLGIVLFYAMFTDDMDILQAGSVGFAALFIGYLFSYAYAKRKN